MKVSIVGCTHAGTFSAMNILKEHPDWEVSVFERNDNLSFLSCGIALWVSDRVSDPNKMFYASPEALTDMGAHMYMQHDVTDIDFDNKKLSVKNLANGDTFSQPYDKLVITTGSAPIIPPIPGIDSDRVMLCKNWTNANELKENAKDIKSAIVIGAGYIGAELAEGYATLGKETTLIDALPDVLAKNLDPNMSAVAEKDYIDNGVTLGLSEKVESFEETDHSVIVKTDKNTYEADIAVMCVGFRPNTKMFADKFETLPNGALVVDKYMHTSIPDVYSAGDAASVHYNPTGDNQYIPLATNSVRQGILVGKNIEKDTAEYMGTQASSAVELFGRTYAASGLTKVHADALGRNVAEVSLEDNYRPEFMLSTTPVLMNLVWDPETRVVLGGALTSKYDVSQSANLLSLAIQKKVTIDELSMVDFLFQPNFDKPVNYVSALAGAAVEKADSTVNE
ncbi:FAD-dependent oxidoreductase [Companilactobacillus kimchii]|uniref:NAD(FAD)-dependent dehydrogenase n=2 Tax=Companilactobacillus kimchii TaxID=2801452 RepID=A0ABR5NRK4_9LACO|nr:FAD-dependent oxidoreductase [Companilactobacillus kimchii]GEO48538.1 pyridine nucleotide-disulfide oxidoreductase [Companilactobacillus paralimentarius]KAE9559267.1 pyridine nucleotide-disulfide oxidoreductase [Companilactobacillus kimchii]KAE9560790.1 pyridine nucleotide-disulfide oxidoreductase [Companilactobacillus kimchii]KRK50651.1 NAD(FAD)-dependent dehydrogenase [Companilactobacillus kimchii DSM 13961 = JCM 10707]OWF32408.1 NADH peroxidase [Companilactobacillus kimchii]